MLDQNCDQFLFECVVVMYEIGNLLNNITE